MNKKHFTKTAALLLALGFTFGATACDGFFVTDNLKDLQQTVATVDISTLLANDENYAAYASKVKALIDNGSLTASVAKRDLVASFLTVGYTLVQSYGMSYEQAFTTLMTELTNNKIMTQYATAYYLQQADKIDDEKSFDQFKADETAGISQRQKDLYEKYPEVLTMKYFLTDFGKTDEEYRKVVYGLKKSLNETIDSNEASFITADDDDHSHSDARTLPTNVDAEQDDYVPEQYEVYTGRNGLAECGEYEAQEGSTTSTRRDGYNSFLASLRSYGLIQKNENIANVEELEYYYVELSSALSAALLEKYYEDLQDDAIEKLTADKVQAKYEALLQGQKDLYKNDHAAFETALDAVAEDSYLLYGLQDYGFVYNILIPFSTEQDQMYTAIKSKGLTLDAQYQAREGLLNDIEAKDLRGSWFSEHDHANYAYEATEGFYGNAATAHLFFEDNVTNTDKYKELTHYAGQYPYQGTWDGKKATPNTGMKIDGFIDELNGYINFVLDDDHSDGITSKVTGSKLTTYGQADADGNVYTNSKGKVEDYHKFMYYTGKVALTQASAADYFNPESDGYKALSAVNELMFAYSTDPGCLNSYMGYAASAHKTNFVSEFEYAAHWVVKQGVGTYAVVPSDYGWHIVYCSYKFTGDNDGAVFGGYDHNAATGDNKVEGSFSNLFYETLKATSATNHANAIKNAVLNNYQNAVTLYQDKYQDLLDLE